MADGEHFGTFRGAERVRWLSAERTGTAIGLDITPSGPARGGPHVDTELGARWF